VYKRLRLWGKDKLEREEAIVILRELISRGLVNPSFVSLDNINGEFSLMFDADCDLPQLRQFIRERNLLIHEERGYCVVFSS
jgi:hypothetical protein